MSRRRSVGEGSVYEDATRGRWLGSLTLPDGRRKRVVGKNRTEARQKLERLRHSVGLGNAVADGNATLADAVDIWSSRVLAARRLAPRTRERYERHCQVIKDGLGSRRLANLTADDIEALLDRGVIESRLSRDTVSKLRATIVKVLDFAVRRGTCGEQPGRARHGVR